MARKKKVLEVAVEQAEVLTAEVVSEVLSTPEDGKKAIVAYIEAKKAMEKAQIDVQRKYALAELAVRKYGVPTGRLDCWGKPSEEAVFDHDSTRLRLSYREAWSYDEDAVLAYLKQAKVRNAKTIEYMATFTDAEIKDMISQGIITSKARRYFQRVESLNSELWDSLVGEGKVPVKVLKKVTIDNSSYQMAMYHLRKKRAQVATADSKKQKVVGG